MNKDVLQAKYVYSTTDWIYSIEPESGVKRFKINFLSDVVDIMGSRPFMVEFKIQDLKPSDVDMAIDNIMQYVGTSVYHYTSRSQLEHRIKSDCKVVQATARKVIVETWPQEVISYHLNNEKERMHNLEGQAN